MSEHAVPDIFPGLRYRDSRLALAWLEKAFGFRKTFTAEDGKGGILHAEMQLGTGKIMFNGGLAEEATADLMAAPITLYVYVPDVETHYARAKAAGARITRPLADTEYGSREYSARDLDGHHWSFGTYLPAG